MTSSPRAILRSLRPWRLAIVAVLLAGFALRAHNLLPVPPGLTHDEANHGWDSIRILDGVLRFYFPLNYGSEPLYNYVVAGFMLGLGETIFALRLVNVMSGTLAIAATYLWGRLAFGRAVARPACALLAVSFWPIATSRQALRAGLLPLFTVVAVILFWRLVTRAGTRPGWRTGSNESRPKALLAVGFALCLAAMLHTYLAARVVWLLFPLFLGYLALADRPAFRRSWRPILFGLALGWLLTGPMFLYLRAHPEAETRLEMLDRPLQALAQGDLTPVLENGGRALLAFVWPGYGDDFLAYNIPGRPVFEPLSAVLFLVGLAVCLWRWRRPRYAFLLAWFALGVAPSLITGPAANTTRNLGALAPAYLLPAVGAVFMGSRLAAALPGRGRLAAAGVAATWLILAGAVAYGDYFQRWGESAGVRAAYQHSLIEMLDYLEANPPSLPAVISSIYPGAAHDPSIARLAAAGLMPKLRFVDARLALIFPAGLPARLLLPAATPLHPAFAGWIEPLQTIGLRPDDLDHYFNEVALPSGLWPVIGELANFGDAVSLVGWRWLEQPVAAGGAAELMTVWRVTNPARVGPPAPPAFETDVVLFTHVLDAAGAILAQRDSLEAPSWDWQSGDVIVQIHAVAVPDGTPPGLYETVVGVYDRKSGSRLPVAGDPARSGESWTSVDPLLVTGP